MNIERYATELAVEKKRLLFEVQRIDRAISALTDGRIKVPPSPEAPALDGRHRKRTPEQIEAMIKGRRRAAKARLKAAGLPNLHTTRAQKKTKRKLSARALAAIREGVKRRWEKVRREKRKSERSADLVPDYLNEAVAPETADLATPPPLPIVVGHAEDYGTDQA